MIKVQLLAQGKKPQVIVDENSTVGQVLEANGINIAGVGILVNGATVSPNKTLAELHLTDGAMISTNAKADSAVAVKVAGNAMVVQSSLTLEQLRTLQARRPCTLKLYDENDDEIFLMTVASTDNGSIDNNGVAWGKVPVEGCACVTILGVPAGTAEEKKKKIEEHYGSALTNIKFLEDKIAENGVFADVEAEKAAVINTIEVM